MSRMKLSSRIFYIIFTISCASALPQSEDLKDRDYIARPHINYLQAAISNRSLQDAQEQVIRFDSDKWENSKMYFKRRYERELPNVYRSRSNRYGNDARTPRTEEARMLKTYGRGKAQVTRQGQTVNVPNEFTRNGNRGGTNGMERIENEIKPTRRGGCRECPTDQKVIASKGNAFVILPEPCPTIPKMWTHYSGPLPGSKIEGVHTIRGYLGPKKKFCQYEYQVIVRRCEQLNPKDDMMVQCTAENSWGSICNISCGHEKEPVGDTQLECKEDLKWSNPLPTCKNKRDCMTPKIRVKSKISCQTAEMRKVEGDFIPNDSTCKFIQNNKDVIINCKDGKWKVIRKNKSSPSNRSQENQKQKDDPCNPNPCQNGGICMRPESQKGPPLCKCMPQTQGVHCEMRECYYNVCENDGLCFFVNNERLCYCTPEYSGTSCQKYTPQ